MELTIKEYKAAKKLAAFRIKGIAREFHQKTGYDITHISVSRSRERGKKRIVDVFNCKIFTDIDEET